MALFEFDEILSKCSSNIFPTYFSLKIVITVTKKYH